AAGGGGGGGGGGGRDKRRFSYLGYKASAYFALWANETMKNAAGMIFGNIHLNMINPIKIDQFLPSRDLIGYQEIGANGWTDKCIMGF
ncbi:hypothetical protein ACJX0J_009485, partial [Zea mays]